MWVYGVAAGAFVLLIFIVSMIYLAWWVDAFNSPLFIIVLIHVTKPSFFPPFWVQTPLLHPSHHRFCLSFISFSPPSCRPLVRAAATVPRCIALLRPKRLTPMGRQSGWAKTHMRWFTPVPIAKSWLKAAAANEDVEGSAPPLPPNTASSISTCSPWPFPVTSLSVTCLAWLAEWRCWCRWGQTAQ